MKKQKITPQEQEIREEILDLISGHILFSYREDLKTDEEKALWDISEVIMNSRKGD